MAEEYYQLIFKFYHFSGLKQSSNLLLRVISMYILYPLLFVVSTMVMINFFYKYHNVNEIAEVFLSATAFGYMVLIKTLLIFYGPLFEDLIKNRTLFWKYHLFEELDGKKFHQRMITSLTAVKFLWILGAFSTVLHSSAPLFVENLDLPHACWIPGNNKIIRIVIHILEVIFYVEVLSLLGLFDGLFLLMCTELTIQFELLSQMVSTIIVKDTCEDTFLKKLKYCNKYHNFLLEMHEKLNVIFSGYFLCSYFLTIGGICVPLFVIFNKYSNLAQIAEAVFFMTIANIMFIMVVLPADEVEIAAERLANKIYYINWYNTKNVKVLKFILLWLAQAQIPVQMSGGGILKINRSLLLRVQRIGYSVSSLLTGLK